LLTRFNSYASPALNSRAKGYPYGNAVPSRVRMLRTFWPDLAAVEGVGLLPIAFVGQEYPCYVGSTGDIAVFLPFDQLLHLIDLFKAGVDAATKIVNDIRSDTRHGQFRCYELRATEIESSAHDLEAFIACCRTQAKAGPVIDRVSWKVREAFDCSTYAVHVENVGTVLAQSRGVNGSIGLSFVPEPRDTFFLDSYEDSMQSIALPYDVWGPTYAADKLAYSNTGVASVPTFRYQYREFFVSGTTSGGAVRGIHGTAWRLCLPEQWHGERYSYHSLGVAVNEGTRQRGDRRGMVVTVRGRELVVEEAALVYDLTGRHLTTHLTSGIGSEDDEIESEDEEEEAEERPRDVEEATA
jgi:hypothetical protein